MTAKANGGPAFPRPASLDTADGTLQDGDQIVTEQDGMTLRDYFAAKAMAAMIASDVSERMGDKDQAMIAAVAYQQADAMISARIK